MAGQRASTLIDFDDSAFQRTLKEAFARMAIRTEAELIRTGVEVVNKAKMYCPVDTGELRASIQSTEVLHGIKSAYILVGTNTLYAPYVEYGTRFMSAQPFMRPALAEVSGGAFRMVNADAADVAA